MKNVHSAYKALSVVILVLTSTSLAHAAPTQARTWVSSTGMNVGTTCARATPCATFQYALAQTIPGGEIDVIDASDYGPVTIGKSITIDGTQGGGFGSILGGPDGIRITAGTTDVVTIRNLSINGISGGGNGINITSAGAVHIENCVMFGGGGGDGIVDARSGSVNSVFYLYVKDTIVRNNGFGIVLNPGAGVFVIASLTNVRSQDNNGTGVAITAGVYAAFDHCNISGNRGDGLSAFGSPGGTEGTASAASAHVEDTNSSNNGSATGAGFHAGSGGFIRLSTSTSYDNTTGLLIDTGGKIFSYGTNRIAGNSNGNGPPSATIALQ
jgi:hypothetical protein